MFGANSSIKSEYFYPQRLQVEIFSTHSKAGKYIRVNSKNWIFTVRRSLNIELFFFINNMEYLFLKDSQP